MRTSDVAEGYARALFELASLADSVDATETSMIEIAKAVRGHLDLRATLTDASVATDAKRDILRQIFGESATPEAVAIATTLASRDLTDSLSEVARVFGEIAERERGIVVAEVTTAVPLDDALRAKLAEKLSASLGRPVTLREQVDASILGGIVIKVAGRVLDGSISSQLADVRATLSASGGEA
jgi:F-type H+-transporting ATPase subunit delta